MLLYPRKTKFKNLFNRKRTKFLNNRVFSSNFKDFAIVSLGAGKVNNKQIELLRKTLKRLLKFQGKFWLNVYPNKNTTKKSEGIRMGKGKGDIKFWYASVSKGVILLEIAGCSWNQIKKVTQQIRNKLSIKVLLTVNRFL
jgi:large subunit ribosomal protein L16